MQPADLERAVDRALRRLPAPRAPASLLPRVMAAAARLAARPWYARAWLTWPAAWQAASVVALAVLVLQAVALAPYWHAAVMDVSALAAPATSRLAALAHTADLVALVVSTIWRTLVQPFVLAVFAASVVVVLAAGVCWNVVSHVAVGSIESAGASR